MIAKYFENQEGSSEPHEYIARNQAGSQIEAPSISVHSTSAEKSTHYFKDMPYIYVEEVVKFLFEIEFE